MKSITDILTQFQNTLSSLQSSLAAFTPYSNTYAILRSVASVISSQYNDVLELFSNSFLTSATGDALDYRALDYNLFRLPGYPATGYVYATSPGNSYVIPEGTVLSTSTQQFTTTQAVTSTPLGVFIPISSISNTSAANLDAGTALTSSLFPNVSFIVGNTISLSGTLAGGLLGGQSPEDDGSFRSRIISYLNNLTKGTYQSISDAISSSGITKYFISENTPNTGFFTVYVNTSNQSTIDSLTNYLTLIKPLGTNFQILTINTYPVDLRFVLTLSPSTNSSTVISSIKQIATTYFNSLALGQPFYPINVATLCATLPGVTNLRIVDPNVDYLVGQTNTLYTLRNVYLTTTQ